MLRFHATDDQIKEVICLLYKHSEPVGMGFLQYVPGPLDKDMIELDDRIYLDYLVGRMVKFGMNRHKGCIWETRDTIPHPEYQSWARKFPTIESLLRAAGITKIVKEETKEEPNASTAQA